MVPIALAVILATSSFIAAEPQAERLESQNSARLVGLQTEGAADLSGILEPIRAEAKLPAMALAIVSVDGQARLLGAAACGVRERKVDAAATVTVGPDDLWHLGSCTKAFTATLCAILVDEGMFRWDSTVGELLGSPIRPQDSTTSAIASSAFHEGWKSVTVEDLLRHRGGAPANPSAAIWRAAWQCKAQPSVCRATFVASLLADAPARERGTFEYSNQGYAIVGRLCEVVTGKAWEELVVEKVCDPLGITSAGFGVPSAHKPDRATKGHKDDGTVNDIDNPQAIAPAGTMHMTIGDWARFVAFHVAPSPDSRVRMSQGSFDRLHATVPPPDARPGAATDPKAAPAMGWFGATRPWGGTVLTHAGSNTSWYCVTWLSPSRKFAVLVTCNQGGAAASKAADAAAFAGIQWWQQTDKSKTETQPAQSGAPGS
jgi:CubicO group peptidase (beta-lactamase class C family)